MNFPENISNQSFKLVRCEITSSNFIIWNSKNDLPCSALVCTRNQNLQLLAVEELPEQKNNHKSVKKFYNDYLKLISDNKNE